MVALAIMPPRTRAPEGRVVPWLDALAETPLAGRPCRDALAETPLTNCGHPPAVLSILVKTDAKISYA